MRALKCIADCLDLAGKALIVLLAFLACLWLIVDMVTRLVLP